MAKLKTDDKIKELMKENKALKAELKAKKNEIEYLYWFYNIELNKIDFKRFLRLNYKYIKREGVIKYTFKAFKSIIDMFGMIIQKLYRCITGKGNPTKELQNILSKKKGQKIFVFYPGYDWNMKMYQRPQHMAMHFSDKNILFFYCTANFSDNINGFKKIKENLYVTNQYELLKEKLPQYTLYMPANVSGCYLEELESILKKGNNLLYEYIDDLHEDLTDIPKELIDRHKYILKDKSIPVIITADNLYQKAKKIRKIEKNLLLSTNGVVYEDFHITKKLPVPERINDLVQEKKPIIGYYGALANWFDYELIIKMAKKHQDWNILLIGIDYDKTLAKYYYFKNYKNIHYIGTVNYKELINYGNCCNVLTIPFLINDITLSTSPVKVFEYMSMEKPIVTTDLPECRKYKSVMIGKNHNEFIKKVEEALNYQSDEEYKKTLRNEALTNTWDKKVEEILKFIEKKSEE